MTDTQQPTLSRSAKRRLRDPSLHLARTLERGVAYSGQKGPTVRPEAVRIATLADIDALWPLLELDAVENSLAPVAWDKVRGVMAAGMRRDGGVIGAIDAADQPGVLAATVGINLMQPWYTEQWCCEEMWSFVHPDYRKASLNYANMLIDFSKWWAEQLEVPLFMGVVSNTRTIGKVRLYSRRIRFIGGIFLHNEAAMKGE